MMTREQWLEERRNHLGASEVAAILGVDPRYEALNVWEQKVMGAETPDADWLDWGRGMEEPVARLYAKRSERHVVDLGATEFQHHPDIPWLAATLDRQIDGSAKYPAPGEGHGALEIKNLESPGLSPDEWNADNVVLLHHVIQNQIQMACTGWDWGCVVGHFPYYRLPWFDQTRDDELLAKIYPVLDEFWNYNVAKKIQPEPMTKKSLPVIKRLYGNESGETIVFDDLELVKKWETAKATIKAADEQKDEIEAKIRSLMRDATFGALPDGSILSLKTTTVKGYTKVVQPNQFRVLRRSMKRR